MPPFRTYYQNRWRYRQRRRRPFRRWRPRKNIRRRVYRRRQPRVRRKRFKKYRKRKLKKIVLTQWQPDKIRKCRIEGLYPLFQAAPGCFGQNFTLYKESLAHPKYPDGGGWAIFKLGLDDLYREHEKLQNWWTYSNKGLNLVRYGGVRMKFYRQKNVDYVVNYQLDYPFEMTRFHYMSTHPSRMLMFNRKIVVPSFETCPLMKRTYIRKKIHPPKQFYNKWFFQKELSKFGLVLLTVSACDLRNTFISPGAENNTLHIWSLNTNVFKHKMFKPQNYPTFGYTPGPTYYLYAEDQSKTTEYPLLKDLIYLGNSTSDQPGIPSKTGEFDSSIGTKYPYAQWGNPFYTHYIQKNERLWISQAQPTTIYTGPSTLQQQVKNVTEMTSDILTLCSYNPMADKGYGNEVYWVKLYAEEGGWETPATLDLKYQGFPLWLILWGMADWTIKSKKLQHLDTDYALVIKSTYITPKLPYYVFLSDSFYNGEGPYHTEKEFTSDFYRKNWYPCWQYQKEAIDNFLMSGPAVPKNNSTIQAHMYYQFLLKWGGSPAYVGGIADPVEQPDYPLPNFEQQTPEIENPENDPTKELYSFDIRRDYLTKAAAERLKKDSTTSISLFTDGTTIPRQQHLLQTLQKTTQKEKKKTQKTKKEALQQQLQLLQQYRYQLRHRYYNLTKQLKNSKYTTPESE